MKYKIVLWVLFIGLTCFVIGSKINNKVVYKEVEKEIVREVDVASPILERIAKCESGGSHYDANGQVLMVANTNKSVDVGKYQINNKVWGKKATELGFNLVVEEDNHSMAKWIFYNRGTEDWKYSRKCWVKN